MAGVTGDVAGPVIGCRWFGMHPTTGSGEKRFLTGSGSRKVDTIGVNLDGLAETLRG